MAFALGDGDDVADGILSDDKPGVAGSSDGEALALADGVVSHTIVLAHDFAFGGFKVAWGAGQILAEKFFKVALADEADAGAVLFLRCG